MALDRLCPSLFLFVLLLPSVLGGIYTFTREDHTLGKTPKDFQYRWMRVGMFSPDDAPEKSAPGNGQSFIRFQAELEPDNAKQPGGGVNGLIFHSDRRMWVGLQNESDPSNPQLCCSPALNAAGLCSKVGRVLYDEDEADLTSGQFQMFYQDFSSAPTKKDVDWRFNVTTSGIYYLYIVNCVTDGNSLVPVFINGKPGATFMNPYGYLNGEYYGYLPFFGTMTLVYMGLGVVWLILSVRHRRELLKLQNAIAGVIGLGVIEMATWYFDNLGYNQQGENYVAAMMVGVIVSTFKRTVSRLLVLSVSIGYGVVRPTLGAARNKVILLGLLYCGFSMALNIVELVQRTATVEPTYVIFLVFPVAILDTAFYWWIFLSLMRTIQQLTLKKQVIKLVMYQRFLGTLVAAGIVSGVIIFAQLAVTVSVEQDETWRSFFVWNCLWHLLYFFVLAAIAFLWRPTDNNTRYAYAELILGDEDDEVTLQPLPLNFADISQRAGSVAAPEESSSSAAAPTRELARSTSSDGYTSDAKRSKRDVADGYLSDGGKSRRMAQSAAAQPEPEAAFTIDDDDEMAETERNKQN